MTGGRGFPQQQEPFGQCIAQPESFSIVQEPSLAGEPSNPALPIQPRVKSTLWPMLETISTIIKNSALRARGGKFGYP